MYMEKDGEDVKSKTKEISSHKAKEIIKMYFC